MCNYKLPQKATCYMFIPSVAFVFSQTINPSALRCLQTNFNGVDIPSLHRPTNPKL